MDSIKRNDIQHQLNEVQSVSDIVEILKQNFEQGEKIGVVKLFQIRNFGLMFMDGLPEKNLTVKKNNDANTPGH